MEKRFFLALLLTGIVLVVTPMIFRPVPAPVAAPSTAAPPSVVPTPGVAAPQQQTVGPSTPQGSRADNRGAAVVAPVVADTIRLTAPDAAYAFSSIGAAPVGVTLPEHRSLSAIPGPVVIRDAADPLLSYRIISGADTIRLDRAAFRATTDNNPATPGVTFTSADPAALATIEYRVTSTPHLSRVRVTAPGLVAGRSYLLLGLAGGFVSQEADTVDDARNLGYAAKPIANGAKGVAFASLDPGERELVPGPLSWAVAKSKYFVVAALSPNDSTPFSEMQVTGGALSSKLATRAIGTVVIPIIDGKAEFDLYAGPLSWERMRAMGREFETANPYGGFMQGMVQPFSTIVMRTMLWLKRVVRLDYGWVLVIFGLAIRILLWPLNQSAMRTSIRLQRVQPELMAVQEKYKSDRTKQQQEIMRVYAEHGMSPFSALSGCLPAIIPMPIFFALFFVFQNTIEFRGVPFLWLSDISLKDPLYILPVVTGLSMFVLSWIGMRNMPKNPQATMMLYLMPGMFTVFLLTTASGLSIYYLVQQIAAIPQQWMIANERRKAQPVVVAKK
jgi:YidC/Oxa1 family membrane protein insertase